MLLRLLSAVAVVIALVIAGGCTDTPQDVIGDKVIDAVRDTDSPVMPRFSEATNEFEKAILEFNTSPIDTPAALVLAEDRLRELRSAFDRWSPIVDEVIDRDVEGTPKAELRAWRDAARRWIAAQEAITEAMVACDDDRGCLETTQERHIAPVTTATLEAQEAKRQFLAAVPDR